MLEAFTDITDILRGGVYILRYRDQIVYVGKARGSMLARIASHRSLARKSSPDWLPIKGVVFDEILVQPVHPDRLDATYQSLVDRYQPRFNNHLHQPSPPFAPFLRRV